MKKKTIWISAAAAVVALGAAGIGVAVADPFDGDDRLSGQTLKKASAAALAEVGDGTVEDASASDDLDHAYEVEVRLSDGTEVDVALDDNYDVVWTDRSGDSRNNSDNSDSRDDSGDGNGDSDGVSDDAASGAGTDGSTTAPQGSTDADDVPLTDAERTGAEQAALAEVGDGTVTDIDRSNDADHAFEVEVTFADGRDVDVELTTDFQVVRVDDDSQPATN
jgi:uncharacterized membrane protein YkoI